MGPEGHGFVGFCLRVKKLITFVVVDVMAMNTTAKHVLTQYPYEYTKQKGTRHHAQLPAHDLDLHFSSHLTFMLYNKFSTFDIKEVLMLFIPCPCNYIL